MNEVFLMPLNLGHSCLIYVNNISNYYVQFPHHQKLNCIHNCATQCKLNFYSNILVCIRILNVNNYIYGTNCYPADLSLYIQTINVFI